MRPRCPLSFRVQYDQTPCMNGKPSRPKGMAHSLWCVVLLCLLTSDSAPASSESAWTAATGEATGVTESIACAEARRVALRDAVEKVTGTRVGSHAWVRNNQVVRKAILLRSEGFVARYEIVNRHVHGVLGSKDVACVLNVRAQVAQSRVNDMADTFKTVLAMRRKPRILMMIDDLAAGANGHLETRMVQQMNAKGWTCVEPDMATVNNAAKGIGAERGLSVAEIKRLGTLAAADVVIVGNVHIVPEASNRVPVEGMAPLADLAGISTVPVTVALRAIATDSGEIYGSFAQTVHGAGFTERKAYFDGVIKAADQAVEALDTQVITRWLSESYTSQRVSMTIDNVKDYRAAQRFVADMTEQIPMVSDVHPRTFHGTQVLLDVECDADAYPLAHVLAESDFRDYRIHIVDVTAHTIHGRVVARR